MKRFVIFILCALTLCSCSNNTSIYGIAPEGVVPYLDTQTAVPLNPVDITVPCITGAPVYETQRDTTIYETEYDTTTVAATTAAETEPQTTNEVTTEIVTTAEMTKPYIPDTTPEMTYRVSQPQETVPETTAHTHHFVMTRTLPATLMSEGYDLYQCECGKIEHRNIVPAANWTTFPCTMNDLTALCPNFQDEWVAEVRYAHIRDTDITKEKYYLTPVGAAHFDEIIAYEIIHPGENPDIYKSFLIQSADWDTALEARTRWARRREAFFAFYGAFATAVGEEYTETAIHPHNPHYFEIHEWADDVIQQLGITTQTSQYNAIDAINQYLCDNFHYDNTIEDRYEAFCQRRIRCYEYCVLFQLLCGKCGIQCDYIHDTKINHAFNSVTFPDGTVKYIDVTWNDYAVKYHGEYFEAEDAELSPSEYYNVRHAYFLMDKAEFANTHTW